MKIGIIGAMIEEITPLVEFFKAGGFEIKVQNLGSNNYHCVKIGSDEVVIAYSKIGKVHSALTAAVMIGQLGCEKIIFSGVAGGLRGDLKVGDLMIATQLAQHDVDISAFGHPLGFIPESKRFMEADSELNALARQVAANLNIKLKEGVIASGDQFIANSDKKAWIVENFNAAAVEMEGASVAVVCDAFKTPFCVFRSISDAADGNADVSFDVFLEHAAEVSAKFTIEMLKGLGLRI